MHGVAGASVPLLDVLVRLKGSRAAEPLRDELGVAAEIRALLDAWHCFVDSLRRSICQVVTSRQDDERSGSRGMDEPRTARSKEAARSERGRRLSSGTATPC